MAEVEHRAVIVIGAGPAGTTCARRLAESGIDVLVLERREVVGHPAQCGECIPNWGEVIGTFAGLDDHAWLEETFDVPDRIKLHRLDAMRVFLPSGHHYTFKLDAYAGHRPQFDGYLAERAEAVGAEIRVGVKQAKKEVRSSFSSPKMRSNNWLLLSLINQSIPVLFARGELVNSSIAILP